MGPYLECFDHPKSNLAVEFKHDIYIYLYIKLSILYGYFVYFYDPFHQQKSENIQRAWAANKRLS